MRQLTQRVVCRRPVALWRCPAAVCIEPGDLDQIGQPIDPDARLDAPGKALVFDDGKTHFKTGYGGPARIVETPAFVERAVNIFVAHPEDGSCMDW